MLCIIERGRQRRDHLVKSRRLVLRFPRTLVLKVHLRSEYVIISLNIKSVLQPTAAKFKGSLVWWPRAWLTFTHHTHTHTGSTLTHGPAVPVWPQGWLITGRSNISEIMRGLSHTVSASGHTCNPALPIFFFLPSKFPTKWKLNGSKLLKPHHCLLIMVFVWESEGRKVEKYLGLPEIFNRTQNSRGLWWICID